MKNFSSFENLNTLFTAIGSKLGFLKTEIDKKVITLTKAQYDALSTAEKLDLSKVYYVTDYDPITVGEIDDTTTALDKVWSSSKVSSELYEIDSYNLDNNVKVRKNGQVVNLYRPYYGSTDITFSASGWQTLAEIPEGCEPPTLLSGVIVDNRANTRSDLPSQYRTALINDKYYIQVWVFENRLTINPMFTITYIV